MKGIVFNMLNEMVEGVFGFEFWDEVITENDLESEGIYTSAGTYSDEEILQLVSTISEKKSIPIPDLLYQFGLFSFDYFKNNYEHFFKQDSSKKFLESVDPIIHVEVKKLYPSAFVPEFQYQYPDSKTMVMTYTSPRKLFDYAHGLIDATIKHFPQEANVERKDEEDCCHFHIRYH